MSQIERCQNCGQIECLCEPDYLANSIRDHDEIARLRRVNEGLVAACKGALTVIDSFVLVEEDAPKLKAAVDKRREAIVAALRSATEKDEP